MFELNEQSRQFMHQIKSISYVIIKTYANELNTYFHFQLKS
jgi:hypothetical protein